MVPALFLAVVVHLLLDRFVWPKPGWVKLAAHIPAALLLALTWYFAILVVRALKKVGVESTLVIDPFSPVAFAWQMFQGVTFYALVALASLAIVLGKHIDALQGRLAAQSEELPHASSVLIKTKGDTERIAIDDIVAVSGAGDYAELSLADKTVLSTSRLGHFEAVLPFDRFLRAHRSHLVRIDAIVRTEPAGNGRTTLHLENGSSVTTSRAGSRLLKEAAL